jgi:hypothetical protein
MTPERWRQVTEVFHAALALDAPAREAYLDRACASDHGLREEINAMLAAHHTPAGFGDRPVIGAIDGALRLETGAMVGAYRIDRLIGAGGMGEVYRALDTNLGRQVAIKVLPDTLAHDPERVARFEREAHMLAALNHPYIAHIYDVEKSQGTYALVMELVEGPTLADRIARGPVPVDEVLPVAKQIAEALEAAHEQGIIHRDLKPANIKLRPDGTVKVLDFGLAKAMEPVGGARADVANSPPPSPAATQRGVILGTAAYMSPEQAIGKPVDRRTDLWAFGVVLLELLTGWRVFDGDTVSHVVAAVLTKEPDWTRLPPTTPAPVRRLLRRCLEKDRKRRMESAADARLEIEEALAPAVETTEKDPARAARTPVWRRALPWAAGIVLGSPDGARVAFHAGDGTWKKVAMLGGPAVTLAPTFGVAHGAAWGPDDTVIVGGSVGGSPGLWRLPAAGGEPTVLTTKNATRGEIGHWWPEVLPGGRAVLFTIVRGERFDTMEIAVLDLTTGEQRTLVPGGSRPRFALSGHLIYGVNGRLMAVPFDRDRLELAGSAVPVVEGVLTDPLVGLVEFDVSADGSLVYVAGSEFR